MRTARALPVRAVFERLFCVSSDWGKETLPPTPNPSTPFPHTPISVGKRHLCLNLGWIGSSPCHSLTKCPHRTPPSLFGQHRCDSRSHPLLRAATQLCQSRTALVPRLARHSNSLPLSLFRRCGLLSPFVCHCCLRVIQLAFCVLY